MSHYDSCDLRDERVKTLRSVAVQTTAGPALPPRSAGAEPHQHMSTVHERGLLACRTMLGIDSGSRRCRRRNPPAFLRANAEASERRLGRAPQARRLVPGDHPLFDVDRPCAWVSPADHPYRHHRGQLTLYLRLLGRDLLDLRPHRGHRRPRHERAVVLYRYDRSRSSSKPRRREGGGAAPRGGREEAHRAALTAGARRRRAGCPFNGCANTCLLGEQT